MPNARRCLRWFLQKPTTYWEVWFIDAAGFGLVPLIVWATRGKLLTGIVIAVIAFIARGAVQSYRLDQRRNSSLGQ